ncbi:MAG: four helix bundle protein [Bacteroidia bacterium]|nr:four helix bundle protein [Bacteroidia bacterium]
MHDFKKFKVWQRTRIFTKEIYLLTNSFPQEERFGITGQIRRATVSISNNFAEGCGRNSDKEFKQFLHYSYGSSVEVENLMILISDLNFAREDKMRILYEELIEIQKMLFTLIKKYT